LSCSCIQICPCVNYVTCNCQYIIGVGPIRVDLQLCNGNLPNFSSNKILLFSWALWFADVNSVKERKELFRRFSTRIRADNKDVDTQKRLIENVLFQSVILVYGRRYSVLWTGNEFVNRPNRLADNALVDVYIYIIYMFYSGRWNYRRCRRRPNWFKCVVRR